MVMPLAILALAAATPVAANAGPATAVTGPATLQAQFDAATRAWEANDCAAALPIFARLSIDPRVKPGTVPAGAIALRQGQCLVRTGADEEGESAINRGLVALRTAGPGLAGDVSLGEVILGDIAAERWDHDAAVAHYQAARALVTGADRLGTLSRLAKVLSFDGGDEALGVADEGLRILAAMPKPNKLQLAGFHTLHARVLLNQGRTKEAFAELEVALSQSGGLTTRVSIEQATMRADLAEAALLVGRKDQARTYLAYTGAGRIAESPFAMATAMDLPQCGPETGLSPDEVAIVEFGIAANGTVDHAQTIYARGTYTMASAFARAVSGWYWDPDSLAKVPAFYRLSTRVELRCSASGGGIPGVTTPLRARFTKWATTQLSGNDFADTTRRHQVAVMHRILAAADARHDAPGAIAALGMLALAEPARSKPARDRIDRALALAPSASVPIDATGFLRLAKVEADLGAQFGSHWPGRTAYDRMTADAFTALAQDPLAAADPLLQDTALIMALPRLAVRGQSASSAAILRKVADDERLGAGNPLRQLALLKLANLSAVDRDFTAAQGYFQRTGLSEEQCSLIGPTPARRNDGAADSRFPLEAMQMGFEGWVREEFNINADGTTGQPRPTIAYPPFVFVEAASQVARGVRYEASFRPAGGSACSAHSETIRFAIPQNH